jgi:hypothetical protein
MINQGMSSGKYPHSTKQQTITTSRKCEFSPSQINLRNLPKISHSNNDKRESERSFKKLRNQSPFKMFNRQNDSPLTVLDKYKSEKELEYQRDY